MKAIRFFSAIVFTTVALSLTASAAEDRRARVLSDRVEVQSTGEWIYDDLPKAIAEATRTRKPMLVVFRCIP